MSKSKEEFLVCPYCKSKDVEVVGQLECSISEESTGKQTLDCVCKTCTKEFEVGILFKYKITNGWAKKK